MRCDRLADTTDTENV
jgi:hypothetical protein